MSGSILPGQTVVYRNSSATAYSGTSLSNAAVAYNGDDAVALYKISTSSNVDIFGRIGEDPGSAWTSGTFTTVDKTLVRKKTVTTGVTVNPSSGFPTLATEWIQFNIDDVSNLGSHTFNEPIFVSGYENLLISDVFKSITGLSSNVPYYYRVRATSASSTSANSNVKSVTTLTQTSTTAAPKLVCIGTTSVTLTAIVSPDPAGGTVQFSIDDSPVGSAVAVGAGGEVSLTWDPSALLAANHSIKAEFSGAGIFEASSGTSTLTVDPLPIIYNVTGGGSYCASGSGVTITLSGSETGTRYYLHNNTTNEDVAFLDGTNAAIDFITVTTAGTYSIKAIDQSDTHCESMMSGTVEVVINSLPVATATKSNVSCNGGNNGSVTITPVSRCCGLYLYPQSWSIDCRTSSNGIYLYRTCCKYIFLDNVGCQWM
ncbi:MAG: Ig-like domain repeat protein [Bacteroidales bacterium]|nr:Ig-like domain repeat protein [Bacteroidales bacterium]